MLPARSIGVLLQGGYRADVLLNITSELLEDLIHLETLPSYLVNLVSGFLVLVVVFVQLAKGLAKPVLNLAHRDDLYILVLNLEHLLIMLSPGPYTVFLELVEPS